jgi:energy-coupling factor transporter ATP-binding protein EcfA2
MPMVSKAQVMALTAGDSWLEKGANLLLFGPPGAGKSHLAAAIGLALVEHGWRVLTTMKDVVTIAPLGGDPGLIAYECPDCGHLTSVLVPPNRR